MGIIKRSLVLTALMAILSIQPGHAGAAVATEQGNRVLANQADLIDSQADLSVGHAPDSKADARTPRWRRVSPFARLPQRQSLAKSFAPGDDYWDDRFVGPPGVDGSVFAIAVSGSNVYVGGSFALAGGVAANNIAEWNGTMGTWSALGSGVNGDVNAIAVVGSDIYVGGSFTEAGGVMANNIAVWDGQNWSALGSGVNGSVLALAAAQDGVYVGGEFTQAGGKPSYHFARWLAP
jgi:hypothetical protein